LPLIKASARPGTHHPGAGPWPIRGHG